MPKCLNCLKKFPTWNMFEGKLRNSCKRKYCFDCSPWRGHNTRPLISDIAGVVKTIREASRSDFICKCGKVYVLNKKRGNTTSSCGSCKANERRFMLKAKAIAYKGGGCSSCGYNKCASALQFHHLDPNEKDFGLGGHHGRKWESIKAELDKCVMLCANCHAEEHDRQVRATREEAMESITDALTQSNVHVSKLLSDHIRK